MAQTKADTGGRPAPRATSPARLEAARRFSVEAARNCADLRCRDVRILEVAGLSPVCDFFVLATAVSARQIRTVARKVEELAEEHDLPPISSARGETSERWVAVDLVDVIVHIMSEEARLFYDLDNLWGDAQEVSWAREGEAAP